jgi:hypothetical protein
MELKELKKRLAAEAKEKGICREWYEFILNAPSKERLLTLFVKGLDFCVENDYPSAQLRAEFAGLRQHFGIFMSDHISVKSGKYVIAFGTSEGKAAYSGFDVAQIWAREDTRLGVTATDNAVVCIEVADRAQVTITASGAARVSVFLHGGTITKNATDKATIKVIDKSE